MTRSRLDFMGSPLPLRHTRLSQSTRHRDHDAPPPLGSHPRQLSPEIQYDPRRDPRDPLSTLGSWLSPGRTAYPRETRRRLFPARTPYAASPEARGSLFQPSPRPRSFTTSRVSDPRPRESSRVAGGGMGLGPLGLASRGVSDPPTRLRT